MTRAAIRAIMRKLCAQGFVLATRGGGSAVIKLGMIASLLVAAAAGGGNYYGIAVPERERAREAERQLDQARADAARRAARLAAEHDAQRGLGPQQAAAETGYQACLAAAGAVHESSWSAQCQRLADENARDRADCLAKLNLSKAYCDASYPARDGSAQCVLPEDLATVIDAALARARNRCIREREAAAPQ
jgi:hypothetical protein